MRALYATAAISLGFWALIAAALFASAPWLAVGLLAMACGAVDLMRLAGVSAAQARAYVLDCALLLVVLLILSLFKPSVSDAPHELD